MTAKARLALQDCEAALEDLRAGPTGLFWRTRWAAAVALLRSVGHVLRYVDRVDQGGPMRQAIDEEYARFAASKPEPAIFWGFIDRERHNILKNYRSAARQNVTVFPGTASPDPRDAAPSRPTEYEHIMSDGPYAGRDPREVVQEAIKWWYDYLDRVDRRAAELSASGIEVDRKSGGRTR